MAEKNLTNKNYPNLPDAPAIVTVQNFGSESPYHVKAGSKEEWYKNLAQIRLMAIIFVAEYSHSLKDGELDFRLVSLPLVDSIIERKYIFDKSKPEYQENFEIYICSIGAYVGMVLESYLQGKGTWHVSQPHYFSGFRFPSKIKKGDSEVVRIVETSPFAAASRRVLEILGEGVSGEPSMAQYGERIIDAYSKGIIFPAGANTLKKSP